MGLLKPPTILRFQWSIRGLWSHTYYRLRNGVFWSLLPPYDLLPHLRLVVFNLYCCYAWNCWLFEGIPPAVKTFDPLSPSLQFTVYRSNVHTQLPPQNLCPNRHFGNPGGAAAAAAASAFWICAWGIMNFKYNSYLSFCFWGTMKNSMLKLPKVTLLSK